MARAAARLAGRRVEETAVSSAAGQARRALGRWEAGLVLLAVVVVLAGQWYTGGLMLSSYNLETAAANSTVMACLALGVAPVIIAGDIDISIAATLSLTGVFMARIWEAGVNIWLAALLAVVLGSFLGLVNGLVVVLLDLPSLAVTLGTLGAYTGASFLILQGNAITGFPSSLTAVGTRNVPGTPVPVAVAIVVGLALALSAVVHGTRFGKSLFAIGGNRRAALFSGIAVSRVRLSAFVLAGVFSAVAAVLYLGDYNTAQATIASDQLLPAITAVILGGVSAYGGTGTIPGVVLAIALLTLLQEALGLHQLSGEAQTMAVGALLVVTIGSRTAIRTATRFRHRARARAAKATSNILGQVDGLAPVGTERR
jgi:rhamnose transport system permease protein